MSNCKYCGKESYGRPFCQECGKKYFGINNTIPEEKPQKEQKTTTKINMQEKDYLNQFTEYSHRKCSYCNNNALLGSYFCGIHQQEINKKQNELYFEQIKEISKKMNILIPKAIGKQKSKYDLSAPNDLYQNKKYMCKNGIIARSKSERSISDFLTDNNIEHYYEKAISFTIYDENNNPNNITLRPDFYIPKIICNNTIIKNVFIEHWGVENNKEYDFKKDVKIDIYRQADLTIICTYEKDIDNPHIALNKKLQNIKVGEINYKI